MLVLGISQTAGAEQRVSSSLSTFSDTAKNRVETLMTEVISTMPQGWQVRLQAVLDTVQLPPLPGLPGSPENLDAITTASRPVVSTGNSKADYTKTRRALSASVAWKRPQSSWGLGANYYNSVESDWLGQQVGLQLNRDLAKGNTNLALNVSHGFDTIKPNPDVGSTTETRYRNTEDVTFVVTQTLTQRMQLALGVETTWVRGFLANPYRQVYAGGAGQAESHPDTRFRRAVFGRIDRWLMTRASISLAARWYTDDWGLQAGTVDARLHQYVGNNLIVRYRYRYHSQGAAMFYRDIYASVNGINGSLTADYKLNNFDSNLFGVKLSVPFEGLGVPALLASVVLDAKYERYFDSQNFGADVFETGFTWPF